jgi:hypothetical protein
MREGVSSCHSADQEPKKSCVMCVKKSVRSDITRRSQKSTQRFRKKLTAGSASVVILLLRLEVPMRKRRMTNTEVLYVEEVPCGTYVLYAK